MFGIFIGVVFLILLSVVVVLGAAKINENMNP